MCNGRLFDSGQSPVSRFMGAGGWQNFRKDLAGHCDGRGWAGQTTWRRGWLPVRWLGPGGLWIWLRSTQNMFLGSSGPPLQWPAKRACIVWLWAAPDRFVLCSCVLFARQPPGKCLHVCGVALPELLGRLMLCQWQVRPHHKDSGRWQCLQSFGHGGAGAGRGWGRRLGCGLWLGPRPLCRLWLPLVLKGHPFLSELWFVGMQRGGRRGSQERDSTANDIQWRTIKIYVFYYKYMTMTMIDYFYRMF